MVGIEWGRFPPSVILIRDDCSAATVSPDLDYRVDAEFENTTQEQSITFLPS
jgi:hypothetical protein